MDRKINKIIITSENLNEKCNYEISIEKIVFSRETFIKEKFDNIDILSGHQEDGFEINMTPAIWEKCVLHYNMPIISCLESDVKPSKNNQYTIKIELTNGELLEKVFSGRISKIGLGLLYPALIFPNGYNKPFWAK